MFAIFDAEGTIVGVLTLNGVKYTTILDTLEDADYRVRLIDNIWDLKSNDEEKED